MASCARYARPFSRVASRASDLQVSLVSRKASSPFHTTAHPSNAASTAILSASLRRVPTHGFTSQALTLGAQDVGYLPISTNLLPRGVFELILHHLVTQREALQHRVDEDSLLHPGTRLADIWEEGKIGVGGRVRGLVLERLRGNVVAGIVPHWQQALAIMAQPSCIPPSTRELWALADEIWYLAGDVALDTSYYTKRASLSAIFAATEVFQTQDQSTEFRDTERFLDARLQELRTAGSAMGAVAEWLGYTAISAVNVARSKGMRI